MISLAPHRYVSAQGIIQEIGSRLEPFGERALVIGNKTAMDRYGTGIRKSLKQAMIGSSLEITLGECCMPEIERIGEEARREGTDMVIGVGAGRSLDVAKYAGNMLDQRVVTVPTVASSSASFTNQVYLYTEDGEFLKRESMETCPDLLLMDYSICGNAEPRHLIAGMGAALAQTFPRKLSRSELEVNQPRAMAFDLSQSLREGLFERGVSALNDVKSGEITEGLEAVLDMNVLHAGLIAMLGGQQFRTELAQYLAFNLLKFASNEILYGELVGFTLLAQELLRTDSEDTLRELVDFYEDVGLPLTFEELGLPENQLDTVLSDAVEDTLELYAQDQEAGEDLAAGEVIETLKRVGRAGRRVRQSGVEALAD